MFVSLIPMIILLVLFFILLKTRNNENDRSSNSISYKNNSQKKREIQFKCNMCGATWYATEKDIKDAKKMNSAIKASQLRSNLSLTKTEQASYQTQIAQMTIGMNDPLQCKHCGSRNVDQKI